MTNKEKLNNFLNLFDNSSKILVVINADPDSIASAMAIKRLLWRLAKEVVIAYFNKISRPDNLAMVEHTDAGIVRLDRIKKENHNTFVIVDSQPDHHENFSKFDYDAIIDHHPLSDDNAKFVDIRPDFGACATIMTQYLKTMKIKPSSKLAAALMIGIKTDTSNFTRQTNIKDIMSFQYLYQFADNNIVTKVERTALSSEELDLSLIRKEIKQVNKKALADWIMSKIKETAGIKIN